MDKVFKRIENLLIEEIKKAFSFLYNHNLEENDILLQKTKKEFAGDFTIAVFPFVKFSKKNPEQTADDIGNYIKTNLDGISEYNVVKGFLNLTLDKKYLLSFLNNYLSHEQYGIVPVLPDSKKIMIEFSSPNTNKPLHLGHIRNNLLGWSLSKIMEANGHNVIKVNLINDRGIHICKSMLAWMKWGNEQTPDASGKKGDHFVGDYYVKFDKENRKQIEELVIQGLAKEEAEKKTPLLTEAHQLLQKWEDGNEEVINLWKKMNNWVYSGFSDTYNKLGISFDKIYYESDIYSEGREIVKKGIQNNQFFKKEDGSVWVDLKEMNLDEKLLIRADGTTVYITQDIGTICQRFEEFNPDKHIYVVGNEQNYHFQVLFSVIKILGKEWYNKLTHLSYGMVELPDGKMKSREGTVVDADVLISEMINEAESVSKQSGKLEELKENERIRILDIIALGALKYFILKVDPKKNMLFNPEESIDFNGNTGPFIQYTYTRIISIFRKAKELNLSIPIKLFETDELNDKERSLIIRFHEFPEIIKDAGKEMNPALIANYIYELAKEYNQFYHDYSVIKEENVNIRNVRLVISLFTARIIKTAMNLLGIDVPEKM